MTKIINFIYNLSFNILKIIGVFFTLLLFISALLFSASDTDITTLATQIRPDNILTGVGILFVMLALFWLFKIPCKKNPALCIRILLLFTMLFYAVCGIVLICFAKSAPMSDSYFVYEIAMKCSKNNYEDINPTSYLSVFPHQIGLVWFYETLLRFWNLLGIRAAGYVFLQYVNLVLVLMMLYFMYKIIQLVFQNTYTTVCYFVLTWFFSPLFFFVLRIYGDIPSISLFIVGLWAFIKMTSNRGSKPLPWTILSTLCFAVSMATRKNILVALIGLALILLLITFYQKRWRLLIPLGLYILIALYTLPALEALYEFRADNHLDEGTPAIAYICMGMHPGFHANGWYNAFNYNVYVESGHNMEFAKKYSKMKIEKRLTYFKENPNKAYEFYFEKFTSQWCDGTYYSREVTACPSAPRGKLFNQFYSRDGGKIYLFMCNHFQNLLYFGAALFCLGAFFDKEEKTLLKYTGILIAFGGFLFHLLWEANARASLSYTFFLLPTAAAGIANFLKKLPNLHKFYKNDIHNLFHFF